MEKKKKYLECGKIVNTHGIHGAVKLESWCNTPSDLVSLKRIYLGDGEKYRELKITSATVHKGHALVSLEGVNTVEQAQALRNKIAYADRDDLPLDDGENFIADLIDLPVIDLESGKTIGKLTDVINLGASDLYEVETESGKHLIPAVPEFVKEIDLERGIFVSLIEGMLD